VKLELAVRMARIEAEEGHRATYYVQGDLLRLPGAAEQLQEIGSLGHEVAYHYDVLDASDGDYNAALLEFKEYCDLFFETGFKITSVCPHGNPTKKRNGWKSNKDFFRLDYIRSEFPDLIDIVVDFPRLFPKGRYISDAGRKLRIIGDISSNDHSELSAIEDGRSINWSEISDLVNSHSGVVLSLHPHRFYDNFVINKIQIAVFFLLKNTYLKLRHYKLIRVIASRFYKLARRF